MSNSNTARNTECLCRDFHTCDACELSLLAAEPTRDCDRCGREIPERHTHCERCCDALAGWDAEFGCAL